MAAPTYFGSASAPTDNGSTNEPVTSAVTPPASMVAGDLVVFVGQLGVATTGQMSISATGGQTWNTLGETAANAVCVAVWWCEYNGTWSADPSIAFAAQSGTIPATAVMHVFRPGDAGETWAVDQAYTGAGFSAPSTADYAVHIDGQTTTENNTVTLAGFLSADDNTWGDPYISDVDQETGISSSGSVTGIAGGTASSAQINPAQATGQSFTTVEAFDLQAIALDFAKNGSPTDNYYIELLTGSISGTVVATSDNIAANTITASTFTEFNFSTPYSLSAATKYYFRVLRSGSRDTTNYLACRYQSSAGYTGGGLYTRTNNSWSSENGTADLRFTTIPVGPTWTTTGSAQYRNTAGADMSCSFAHCIQATPGYTYRVGKRQTANGGDAGVGFIVSFYSASSGYTLALDQGSYTLSGQAVGFKRGVRLTAEQGSYTLTGQSVALKHGYKLTLDYGSYTLTGQDVALKKASKLTAEQGSYVLTGQAVSLKAGYKLTAEYGSYTLTGQDVTFALGKGLTAEYGSYALTGQDVNLLAGRKLTCDYGSYTLTGQDIALKRGVRLTADSGSYTLTGQDAALKKDSRLICDSGSYALTGQDVTLTYNPADPVLTAETGSYTLTGYDVTFTYDAVTPTPEPTSSPTRTGGGGWTVHDEIAQEQRKKSKKKRKRTLEEIIDDIDAPVKQPEPIIIKPTPEPAKPEPVNIDLEPLYQDMARLAELSQMQAAIEQVKAQQFIDDEDEAIAILLLTMH